MNIKAVIGLLVMLLIAPALRAQTDADEEYRQQSVSSLPPVVLNAARSVAPDVFFDSAESYLENDFRVYRVSGRLFREVWQVFVREDGRVLRTESDLQDD